MGGSGEEVGLGEGRGRGGEKVEQEVALHYIFQLLKFLLGPLARLAGFYSNKKKGNIHINLH